MKDKRVSRNLITMIILLIVLLAALAGVYFFGKKRFETHFYPGTVINGLKASEKTADEVRYAMQDKIREYTLTVHERGGETETITGEQLFMQYVDDGSIDKLLAEQDTKLWFLELSGSKKLSASTGFTYDKEAVDDILNNMSCFQEANVVAPEDARIEDNGTTFEVVDSVEGNTLRRADTKKAIEQSIQKGETEIDFEALDLYEKPAVTSDDEGLVAKAEELNKIVSARITYDFKDREKVVDGSLIRSWIVETDDGSFDIDQNKVNDWVVQMARDTDTFGLSHDFKTSTGETIKLASGGDYGWLIGRDATTEQLMQAIKEGKQGTLEPIYRYKGTDRATNDIGNTYIEICIKEQRMWCYKDGVLVADTPVTTGNENKGNATPSGSVWAVDARKSPAHFKLFSVDVQYWLPFNGNVGIHDASWRSSYGGQIYLSNGSHGCVNTPKDAAAKIYEAISIGDPVVVYYSPDQVVGPAPKGEVRPG